MRLNQRVHPVMFVTQKDFEQYVPNGLSEPGSRYWRAISLSLSTPWYMCVCESRRGDGFRTILIAWESELLDLATLTSELCLVAVARLSKSASTTFRWEMHWVESIWLTAQDEQEDAGMLAFQLENETVPRDDQLQELTRRTDRVLVFSCSERAR